MKTRGFWRYTCCLIVVFLPALGNGKGSCAEPESIAISKDASAQERLAANEVRRYVYLRTGRLLEVGEDLSGGSRIVVICKNRALCEGLGQELEPQQFRLKSETVDGNGVWWVVGGDEIGTLYGAYRFAEKLGVRFGPDDDILPDTSLSAIPGMDEIGKPRFSLRGLQPFHDFSVGPDWWNTHDYRNVLSQMAKMRMNFIGLHTYPSWNLSAGPEANVWIGPPEDVDEKGGVKSGYEAGVVTTRRGWAVTPFPASQYAAGAGLLFENDDYGPDYLLDCLEWPKNDDAATAMFNRYGDSQKAVFEHARRLGVKTCLGTEVPLGVPKELAARLETRGLREDDPEVIRNLYQGTFLRLMRKMQPDYFWFWTPETWLGMEPGCKGWEMTTRENVARDFALAESAAKAVEAPFKFATCGWRLGTPDDASWTDRHAPKDWACSAIGTSLGRDPVETYYGAMTGRSKWVIGWAEDDGTAGAHCCTCWDLQLWANRMFMNSADAQRYGCDGMMAIHWRTAAISPNIMALSESGWDFNGKTPIPEDFWATWGRNLFGGDAGAEAGGLVGKFDGGHILINELVEGGSRTTDAEMESFFAPLAEMERMRSRISGTDNLERFDYWLNFIRATRLRVRTWVLADRLAVRMEEAKKAGAEKVQAFVKKQVLPLRIELARSYEEMIGTYVDCAKSPGEIGTIASIESGNRNRILTSNDAAIQELLGGPLPDDTSVSTAYTGKPRIFVSSRCSHVNAGEDQEIRAFVLSAQKCTNINLFWRPLGKGGYSKIEATHRARQAYRVSLPAQPEGAVEYYLEAALDDGQSVLWPATAPKMNQTTVAW
ncbi:MAG TPA: hypothetical protein PLI09_12045 [Candidatus Hydrogenedentes bacterium]|nr:hypothetical protein [Candidatus Hydrogenedentota bacterium]